MPTSQKRPCLYRAQGLKCLCRAQCNACATRLWLESTSNTFNEKKDAIGAGKKNMTIKVLSDGVMTACTGNREINADVTC
ncbi:hypothetical protein BD289DRAFT_436472 [Coniella lustricola]|uniref:Uncharacterized protein n=1 Tax=Coniella lustricola TaxID=2025994 RepID=A0A2T3A567_9PEZI|nr:hypothetical protein BD289DRAFT_436472 [Coniella lustricola]